MALFSTPSQRVRAASPGTNTRRMPRASTHQATDPRRRAPRPSSPFLSGAGPLGRTQRRRRGEPPHRVFGGIASPTPRAGEKCRIAERDRMSWQASVSQASAEPAARVARPAGPSDELVHPAGQQRHPKPLDPGDAVTVSVAVGETIRILALLFFVAEG